MESSVESEERQLTRGDGESGVGAVYWQDCRLALRQHRLQSLCIRFRGKRDDEQRQVHVVNHLTRVSRAKWFIQDEMNRKERRSATGVSFQNK